MATQALRYKPLIIFIITLLLLSCLLTGGSSALVAAAASDSYAFDSTTVYDDLSSASGFDFSDYPANASGDTAIVNFVEFGYSYYANERDDYALYIYIYNPTQADIATGSNNNKIQIGTTYSTAADGTLSVDDYSKLNLVYCSNYNNLIYKFRVAQTDGVTVGYFADDGSRRYDVSGFELFAYGDSNATETTIGGTYTFTGYAAGLGKNNTTTSTLKCSVTDLETIELDVRHALFRSGSVSSLGVGHQNQLNSVYFAVPNKYIVEYGSLQKVKAEWYEYRTEPIVVLSDADTYATAYPYIGKTLTSNPSNDKFKFYDKSCRTTWSVLEGYKTMPRIYQFNMSSSGATLPYLFYTGSTSTLAKNYTLTSAALENYIKLYNKSYNRGTIEKGYSADLFTTNLDSIAKAAKRNVGHNVFDIDAGATYDLLSYSSTHNWWSTFIDFGIFGKPDTESGFSAAAIQAVTNFDLMASDAAISSNLLIDANYVSELKQYQNANAAESTTYLFRFAQSDYFSLPLYIESPESSNADKWGIVSSDHGYMAQESVFFDFDIIQLTFAKAGVYTVIPVVANPQDVISAVTPPIVSEDLADIILQWLKELWAKIVAFFKAAAPYLIGIAAVIVMILVTVGIVRLVRRNRVTGGKQEIVAKIDGAQPAKRKPTPKARSTSKKTVKKWRTRI